MGKASLEGQVAGRGLGLWRRYKGEGRYWGISQYSPNSVIRGVIDWRLKGTCVVGGGEEWRVGGSTWIEPSHLLLVSVLGGLL